jgi:N-acetylglucosamine-6-sulfatase
MARTKPSIVVIQLDDQVYSDLYAHYLAPNPGNPLERRWRPVLPTIHSLLMKQGVTFDHYYVSVPLCCPSRSALLTGRYAHNNGVLDNGGRHGGFEAFRRHDYRDNLAVWLKSAGYWTIHVGKFLNGYGPKAPPAPGSAGRKSAVPPGWSDWQTMANDESEGLYYGFQIDSNGVISRRYGDPTYQHEDPPTCTARPQRACNYVTDVLTRKALHALATTPANRPLYLQLDYTAPHVEKSGSAPEPPTRYSGPLPGAIVPRTPAFNQRNMSGKAAFMRRLAPLSRRAIARIELEHRLRLESERAVDDGVRLVIRELRRIGRLANTYIVLISDNGWFEGQYRLATGKFLPYDPSNRMPLVIRGPGIPHGKESTQLVANIDLAPTFLQLAGARPTRPFDGRSLLRFARDPQRTEHRAILLESFARGLPLQVRGKGAAPVVSYEGIRVGPYKYIEYGFGEKELYNLRRDPYELRSLVSDPRYRGVRRWLAGLLHPLEDCRGAGCLPRIGRIPRPTSPNDRRRGQRGRQGSWYRASSR